MERIRGFNPQTNIRQTRVDLTGSFFLFFNDKIIFCCNNNFHASEKETISYRFVKILKEKVKSCYNYFNAAIKFYAEKSFAFQNETRCV